VSSIVDVARLAGVSPATVSRVLSSSTYPVSETTRQRVVDAARALDFVPNELARGLLKSHARVIGVIVHDITDPYFADIARGVEDAAAAADFLVIVCSSDRDATREESYVRLLRSIRAAAVVFAGTGIDDPALNAAVARHTDAIRAYGGAVVRLSPHAFGAPDVGVDNAAGMASLVEALGALGHRRIAYVSGPEQLFVVRDRLAGYRAGLARARLKPDAALVSTGAFTVEGGAAGLDDLLARGASFTAVAFANDLMALGGLQRLAERGIDVPGDVSVAGFDDIRTASQVTPSLTSVRLPLHELGRRGFLHAERILAGGRPRRQVLPTEVVLRASTARPKPGLETDSRPMAAAS